MGRSLPSEDKREGGRGVKTTDEARKQMGGRERGEERGKEKRREKVGMGQ
jgi:hypothetical protein